MNAAKSTDPADPGDQPRDPPHDRPVGGGRRGGPGGDRGGGGRWRGIDHVQLAIPPGGEDVARSFYVGVLGFSELPKPAVLAARGGAWFEAGTVQIHVGVEPGFEPARKAHPALLVAGLRDLVAEAGLEVRWSDEIPGVERCHVDDPFGNRIELIEAGP